MALEKSYYIYKESTYSTAAVNCCTVYSISAQRVEFTIICKSDVVPIYVCFDGGQTVYTSNKGERNYLLFSRLLSREVGRKL